MTKITLEQKKKAVELAIIGENPLPYLKKCGSNAPDKTWYAIKAALKEKDPETYAKIPDFRAKSPRYDDVIPGFGGNETAKEPKTAGDAMVAMKEAADNFFSQCEDMGLKMETPTVKLDGPIRIETKEPEKVEIVESPEQDNDYLFTTAAVRNKRLGTFYYDDKHGTIDWRHPCGDEINLSADDYKLLFQALPQILRSLGVGL